MSTQQRRDVFAGRRQRTSGGLTKADLIKNKRGKIVSRKKSQQAGSQNNLGSWLREKGKKVEKAEMLRKASEPPADAPKPKAKKAAAKPKVAAAKPKVAKVAASQAAGPKKAKPKIAPPKKPVPKAVAPKKKAAAPKKKAAAVRKKPEAKPKKKKLKSKPGINPLTQQPYDKKEGSGYVEKAAMSLDNVKRRKRRHGKKPPADFSYLGGGY